MGLQQNDSDGATASRPDSSYKTSPLLRGAGHKGATRSLITGNLICDTEAEGIFLEMGHGPMLIDNNVLLGGGVKANSENMLFAHNLFVDCPYRDQPDAERQSQFCTPHTTRVVRRKPGLPANNR